MDLKATRSLPPNYYPVKTLDFSEKTTALVFLNLLGGVVFVVFGWAFLQFAGWARPEFAMRELSFTFNSLGDLLIPVFGMIGLLAGMIVLHEAIHGVGFWLMTRSRPQFAFQGAYAYAAASGWYLPRTPYLLTTLAPFGVISAVCMLLVGLVPISWILPIAFFATMNAGGAIGDGLVAYWLLRQPPSCLALDQGDATTLYLPAPAPQG